MIIQFLQLYWGRRHLRGSSFFQTEYEETLAHLDDWRLQMPYLTGMRSSQSHLRWKAMLDFFFRGVLFSTLAVTTWALFLKIFLY